MIFENKIIPFYTPWTTPPSVASFSTIKKPELKTLAEEFHTDYTEEDLKVKILAATDLFAGVTISETDLDQLPDGYIYGLYTNFRYGSLFTLGLPVRAGKSGFYTDNLYALGNYVLLSALFTKLYDEKFNTVGNTSKREWLVAQQYLSITNFMIYSILKANPTIALGSAVVVCATTTTYTNSNSSADTLYTVYLSESRLAEYNTAGMTTQEVVDYWNANKEQPPFPIE